MKVEHFEWSSLSRVTSRGARLSPRYWGDPVMDPLDAARVAAAFAAHGKGEVASLPALDRKRCPACQGVGFPWVATSGKHRPRASDFVRRACPRCSGRGVV
jgi:ribosomal protein S27AE